MARLNSSPIRQYRGTTAQHAAYTGPSGELTVDTDKNVVVVQDGTTAGGHPMAREDRKIIGSGGVTINGGSEATLAGDITIAVTVPETGTVSAGAGITVSTSGTDTTVSVDSSWLQEQIISVAGEAITAGDGLTSSDNTLSVDETWLEGKIDSALTDAVSGGLVIAGTGIDVAVSGGDATVSVDETWLNEQIDDAIAEVGSEYDIPLYFDNNSGTTEWGEVHTFLPENASTIKLVASEADGSGTSGITITLAGDISASATSITLGASEASCAALAGKAVVFTISGSSDQTKVSLLALCALA